MEQVLNDYALCLIDGAIVSKLCLVLVLFSKLSVPKNTEKITDFVTHLKLVLPTCCPIERQESIISPKNKNDGFKR